MVQSDTQDVDVPILPSPEARAVQSPFACIGILSVLHACGVLDFWLGARGHPSLVVMFRVATLRCWTNLDNRVSDSFSALVESLGPAISLTD